MRIGIDYRPALVNREGIGRATRELVRALAEPDQVDLELELFGWTLSRSRFDAAELGLADAAHIHLHRRRFPAKLTGPWLRARGGVPRVMGMPGGLFHHTQPRRVPTGSARTTTMIWDLLFLDDDGRPGGPWVERKTAEQMAASARRAADESTALFVPTDFVRQDVIAKLGVEPSRVHVVGLGCDHVATPEIEELPTRPPYVLTVCRVDPRKNHTIMLAAFERLVRAGLPHHWLVVGPDGWRSAAFDAAVAASPARHRIERIKDASEDALAAHFAAADVFLFASHAEGFGLPPLEAMAAGVPVIASAASCLPEVLGDAAVLVDAHDDEALFEALAHQITERDDRAERIARGRAHAARHSWSAAARKHVAAWRSLV